MKNVPRWSGLNHFDGIIEKDFADGKKWDDVSRVSYLRFVACSLADHSYRSSSTSHIVFSRTKSPNVATYYSS